MGLDNEILNKEIIGTITCSAFYHNKPLLKYFISLIENKEKEDLENNRKIFIFLVGVNEFNLVEYFCKFVTLKKRENFLFEENYSYGFWKCFSITFIEYMLKIDVISHTQCEKILQIFIKTRFKITFNLVISFGMKNFKEKKLENIKLPLDIISMLENFITI